MTDTDTPKSLSRRRLLGILGAGAATAVPVVSLLGGAPTADARSADDTAGCGSSDTVEQEVGPFYVAEGVVRSDITSGEDGVPLTIKIILIIPETCEPLVGAAVDVWHASALGVYSDESSEDTVGETFLRGIQISDSAGQVSFNTIFPGWYAGRTNHIHVRVYTGGTVSGTSYDYSDATLIHTGQLFFDPNINTAVAAVAPYTSNTATRTTNARDRVYTGQGGASVLTTTTGDTADGYTSTLVCDVAGTSTTADATSLSMTASSRSLIYGNEVTLAGTLTESTDTQAVSAQKIVITASSPAGTTKRTTTTTGPDGTWATTFRPAASAGYRASYAATSSTAAARSANHVVTVHRGVTVGHVSSTASASHPVVISGRISPAVSSLRVGVHQIVDGGQRTLTHVHTDAAGHWSVRLHLGKGTHRLYAHVPATDNLATGTSRTLTVRRS